MLSFIERMNLVEIIVARNTDTEFSNGRLFEKYGKKLNQNLLKVSKFEEDNNEMKKNLEIKMENVMKKMMALENSNKNVLEGIDSIHTNIKDKESDETRKNEDNERNVLQPLRKLFLDVSNLFATVNNNKECILKNEKDIKNILLEIATIQSTLGIDDTRIKKVANNIVESEGRVMHLIEGMKKTCFEYIIEKHEEIVKQCIFL
jgi:hypothetical protein